MILPEFLSDLTKKRPKRNRRIRRSFPESELLECRQMLTAPVVGPLTIIGTNGSDTILVEGVPGSATDVTVTLNGSTSGPYRPTTPIVIQGLDGNDQITIAANVVLATEIDGGPGTDVIRGGSGDDFISARDSDVDTVTGGKGIDTVAMDSVDILTGIERVNPLQADADNETKNVKVLVLNYEPRIPTETVKVILKENGIDPGPKKGKGSWDEFLKIHADTLWQCDFLSKPMWTAKGLVDVYLLVFLNLGSRRAWISPSTVQPDSAWVSLQARNFLMVTEDMGLAPGYVMRDNDAKFSAQFDEVLKSSGATVKRNTPLSPNLRAHVERFIQPLKFEYLNRFVIVAEKHLDYVCRVWSRHYNEERPHSSCHYLPPDFTSPPDEAITVRVSDIVCSSKLGGVINSYSRRAA